MNVLVDTPIWSLALRRKQKSLSVGEQHLVEEWVRLVRAGQIELIGAIRQELLSGIRRIPDFDRVRDRLCAFEDLHLTTADYERAAYFYNQCRSKGIAGTPIDLLICAAAHRFGLAIFTTDGDFERYAKCLPVRLHAYDR